jgi:hypothetical protein
MSPKEFQIGPVRFIRGEKDGKYPACHSLYLEKAGVIMVCGPLFKHRRDHQYR